MADLLTKVELKLNDLFSPGMAKAGEASNGFAGKTIGACNQVDKALSGTAAKLGALGVTLSLGAAAKGIIDLDHRMTRMGLTANASAEQVSHMKQAIYDVAQASDVKLDPTSILSGLEVVMAKTGDLKYAEENIRNIGLAIQATGESGDSIGTLLSEFHNFKYSSEQISALMDDMVAQASEGAFSLADFAQAAPLIFSTLNAKGLGTAPETIKKTNAALQIINAGTKSPTKAIAAFNAAMDELADKQADLKKIGINVRDSSGNFRDFNDIMLEIAKKSEDTRNADYLSKTFSSSTMQAIRSYITHGERMHDNLVNLGDTTGLLQSKAATMAGTLKSNIQGLQTAFNKFADSNLSKPLEQLTGFLNKMSEDPKRVEAVFEAIKRGVIAISLLKIGAGLMSFISTIRDFTGGTGNITGNINANITESLTASQAMPVYVTNWGAAGNPIGAAAMPDVGGGGQLDQFGKPLAPAAGAPAPQGAQPPAAPQSKWKLNPNLKGAAVAGGVSAAFTAIAALPGMVGELGEIKKNEGLTKEEKGKAKGGTIGQFAGSVTGAAAGAFAGAAIGSVVPVVGTAVGALVGGLIGQFGGPVGRMIGEKIGAAVSAQSPEKAKAAFDRAQAAYDDAIREAANTVGKTAKEMEKARQKVREAEARLEEAKADLETSQAAVPKISPEEAQAAFDEAQAGYAAAIRDAAGKTGKDMEKARQKVREAETRLEAAKNDLETARASVPKVSPEEAQAAFDEAQAGYAAAINDAGETVGKTGEEMEEAYRKFRENEMSIEASKAAFDKAQADLDAAMSEARKTAGKTNRETTLAHQKVSEARMQLDAARTGLEASRAAATEAMPGSDALAKAQADFEAAIEEAANGAGKTSEEMERAYQKLHETGMLLDEAERTSREIEQIFQGIREKETHVEAAKTILEQPDGVDLKLDPQQAKAAFDKAQADFDAARRDAMNRTGKTNWEIERAHQKVSETRAKMEEAKSVLEQSKGAGQKLDPQQARAAFVKAQADFDAASRDARNTVGKTNRETEQAHQKVIEMRAQMEAAKSALEMPRRGRAVSHDPLMSRTQGGQFGGQERIPAFMLPPQLTRTGSSISPPRKAEAEITGNALVEVKVDISEGRPTAKVNVKNSGISFLDIRPTGNVQEARSLSL